MEETLRIDHEFHVHLLANAVHCACEPRLATAGNQMLDEMGFQCDPVIGIKNTFVDCTVNLVFHYLKKLFILLY